MLLLLGKVELAHLHYQILRRLVECGCRLQPCAPGLLLFCLSRATHGEPRCMGRRLCPMLHRGTGAKVSSRCPFWLGFTKSRRCRKTGPRRGILNHKLGNRPACSRWFARLAVPGMTVARCWPATMAGSIEGWEGSGQKGAMPWPSYVAPMLHRRSISPIE